MSVFKTDIIVINPLQADTTSEPIKALVDTGSELTWLPATILEKMNIQRRHKKNFQTATGQLFKRDVGYAILRAEGFETNDDVVFAEPTDLTLLGVRTLEGFGVMVDNVNHRFVATTFTVAGNRSAAHGTDPT